MALAHPLWAIPEVVREVMRQCADEQDTLAQCARVSRVFSEPALEVLWEEQEGLELFFRILSSSIKMVDIGTFGDRRVISSNRLANSFFLCGDIKEEEWVRLQYYANLVRVFTSQRDSIDGLVAAALIQKLNGRTLFPRLKCLIWHRPFDAAASALLVMFLSPMLRTVHLNIMETRPVERCTLTTYPSAAEYAYSSVLRTIHSCAPKVEEILLVAGGYFCTVDRLREFRNLRVLALHNVVYLTPVFDVCKTLPSLWHLDIHMALRHFPDPELDDLPSSPVATLSPLTLLELSGPPLMVVSAVDALNAPNLRSLSLSFVANADAWKRCSASVVSRFGATLHNLEISVEGALRDVRPDVPYLLPDFFAPLFALRDLRMVEILSHFNSPFAVRPQDLTDLATAWPQLRTLVLPSGFVLKFAPPDPGLPITALETLAATCPHLELLIVPLPHHAALLEEGRDEARVPASQSSLKEIRLLGGEWPPEAHERCMSYVKRLFPEACLILFDTDFEDDWSEPDEWG
ncbi:hypothetical protein VTO73DRAFT_12627 [Trametes versicolor]